MAATLPPIDRPIALVGLMGAGKTTVGRRLARRLDLAFVDADEEIERAADRSVPEIFDAFGEAGFREGERRVIARLVEGRPQVIATGGGAFMDERTRALLLERCIVVWLDAELETLAERVLRRDRRPLLQGKDPRPVLRQMAALRSPLYAQAHLRIPSNGTSHERTVDLILEALGARRAKG